MQFFQSQKRPQLHSIFRDVHLRFVKPRGREKKQNQNNFVYLFDLFCFVLCGCLFCLFVCSVVLNFVCFVCFVVLFYDFFSLQSLNLHPKKQKNYQELVYLFQMILVQLKTPVNISKHKNA
jgi:hypothetical protein